jgi:hypothetical protein
MRGNSTRDIAKQHLLANWEIIRKAIDSGQANNDDHEYKYHKNIFEKSLSYIESYDIRYTKDGIYASETDEE